MPQDKSSSTPSSTPLVSAIDHCSLIVSDTGKALEFYRDILELEVNDSRPDLGYPGVWLQVGGMQIHLLQVSNPYSGDNRPKHGGRDHHVALRVRDLDIVVQRLETAGIEYSKSKSGRVALFCRDYDGNAIELVEK